jgi:hypothetical protein
MNKVCMQRIYAALAILKEACSIIALREEAE